MIIENEMSRCKTTFGKLHVGDTFTDVHGDIFLKTSEVCGYNSVCFNDSSLIGFNPNEEIEIINCKLVCNH